MVVSRTGRDPAGTFSDGVQPVSRFNVAATLAGVCAIAGAPVDTTWLPPIRGDRGAVREAAERGAPMPSHAEDDVE